MSSSEEDGEAVREGEPERGLDDIPSPDDDLLADSDDSVAGEEFTFLQRTSIKSSALTNKRSRFLTRISRSWFGMRAALLAWGIFILTAIAWIVQPPENGGYADRDEIHLELIAQIQNDADLSSVVRAFESRHHVTFVRHFLGDSQDFYPPDTLFPDVLEDIRMLSTSMDGTLKKQIDNPEKFRSDIKDLVKDYRQTEPFADLDEEERNVFKLLRANIGEERYPKVHPQVESIVRSLKSRDMTIKRYLVDASKGYYISIVALLFTIIPFGAWIKNTFFK
jgi:hypothetical protein